MSHTISVVFYSHIAALSTYFYLLRLLEFSALISFILEFTFLLHFCLIQIITLSQMNNVCTKAWIWIFHGYKIENTCLIVQFILHSWLNDCFYMEREYLWIICEFVNSFVSFTQPQRECVNFHGFFLSSRCAFFDNLLHTLQDHVSFLHFLSLTFPQFALQLLRFNYFSTTFGPVRSFFLHSSFTVYLVFICKMMV